MAAAVWAALVLSSVAATRFTLPHLPEAMRMLVEPADLEARLRQPGLRLLDTRAEPDYARGHLPGAVRVDVKAWQQLAAKPGGLHDAKAWGDQVGRLGIDMNRHVVVYGSSPPDTARVWWTLKYLGLRDVAVLDGGWPLWVKQNRPTETVTPAVSAAAFEPRFQADRLEEKEPLRKALGSGSLVVVDARSRREFTGEEVRGKRGGHIPGAAHLEWKDLLDADGRFKTPEELRALFRRRGITPEQTAVTC